MWSVVLSIAASIAGRGHRQGVVGGSRWDERSQTRKAAGEGVGVKEVVDLNGMHKGKALQGR
jgi:hypothetical protein